MFKSDNKCFPIRPILVVQEKCGKDYSKDRRKTTSSCETGNSYGVFETLTRLCTLAERSGPCHGAASPQPPALCPLPPTKYGGYALRTPAAFSDHIHNAGIYPGDKHTHRLQTTPDGVARVLSRDRDRLPDLFKVDKEGLVNS